MNDRFNPFENLNNDLEIKSDKELIEAKEVAGVVNQEEHLERLLMSDDSGLIKGAMDRIKSDLADKNKEITEKDNEIARLKEKINALENNSLKFNKIKELLKETPEVNLNDLKQQFLEKIKQALQIKSEPSIEYVSQEEFMKHHYSEVEVIAYHKGYFKKIFDVFRGLSIEPEESELRDNYYNAQIHYIDRALDAINKGKKFVSVDGSVYAVN